MAEQIGMMPQLSASAADSWRYRAVPEEILAAQADRISALNAAIWETPEAFLDVVCHLGHITLAEEERLPESYTAAPIDTKSRLELFLERNDSIRIEFDDESDEAIYGNTEVRNRLAHHNKNLGVQHESVGRDQTRTVDHPEAAAYLDQLSLYKLYLYVRRVQIYRAQTGSKDEGRTAA